MRPSFLFRGMLGNIFSRGLDTYNEEFLQGKGNVYPHGVWKAIAKDIIYQHKQGFLSSPIDVYGHSIGARVAVDLVNMVDKAGVDVNHVFLLDYVAKNRFWYPLRYVKNRNIPVVHYRSEDRRAKKVPYALDIPVAPLNHIQMDDAVWVHKDMFERAYR